MNEHMNFIHEKKLFAAEKTRQMLDSSLIQADWPSQCMHACISCMYTLIHIHQNAYRYMH